MKKFYARSVFFVRDTPRAMEFYTKTLGFHLDWTHEERGRPYVVQVSLLGMEIILNQTEIPENDRPGHGRLFVGLDEAQTAELLQHIQDMGISATYTEWGAPTLVIVDLDQNELFFWLSDAERARWQQAHAGAIGRHV
jgi:catechol 2,3-dioxygenase-like lactoylglutathione lyase family enzyme